MGKTQPRIVTLDFDAGISDEKNGYGEVGGDQNGRMHRLFHGFLLSRQPIGRRGNTRLMMNETLIHPGTVSCPIWVSFRLILSLDGEGSDVFTSHEREKL